MKIIFLLLLLLSSISLHASPSCQAKYDEMGIPHQEVTSNKEFYYCFGFHHGKDRAWQMDFFRRFAYGTNAEVLGYKFIKNDFMMRLLDLPKLAARLYEELSIESKELLQNYTEGVNEGFKEGKLSDEFIKLGFTPAKWEPLHSIAVLLLQSFDQTKKTFFFDIKEQEKLDRYPDAKKLFDENETPWLTTILKEGEYQTQETRGVSAPSHNKSFKLWAAFPELFGRKSGSNNWVVNSNYTKNKVAILANDPHLDLKTPSFWYWVHLKSQDNQVIGASLPGLPFVASGTNGKVSWGLTNSYLNSADSIEITDIDKKDITSVRPVIWFKFGFFKLPFFFKSIEKFNETYPVLPLEVPQRDKVVLRWSGYTLKASEITPMFELHKQGNVTEVDSLLATVGVPSWNYVFADTQGDIGYRMVGKTFKNKEDPFGVEQLTKEQFLDMQFLEPSERPQLLKPQRPFVVTANNQHWPEDALYKGGRGYSLSFRANRIEEKLSSNNQQSIETTKDIQCDLFVTDAKFFIPVIRKYLPDFLNDWDMISSDTSREMGFYRRFMDLMMDEWDVNESALFNILNSNELSDKKVAQLHVLYEDAKKEVGQREWKDLAYLPFEHLSGDDRFKYSPLLPALGDEHTVAPGTTRWNTEKKKYEHFSGASMRMIVEMSNPVKILLSLPGKNRGYQSENHENPWEEWRGCRYFELAL